MKSAKSVSGEVISGLVLASILFWVGLRAPATAQPNNPSTPTPTPHVEPEKAKPRRILPNLPRINENTGGSRVVLGDRTGPGGALPTVDYPEAEWFKNIGSKLDGAGMCVFTAFEFSCRWSGLEEFRGFRDWAAQKYKGGGWPEKLDEVIDAYCKAKGIQRPTVIQYAGSNPEFLEKCLRNGWLPGCTLYHSSRREYPATIYHMTNCAEVGTMVAILDNNFPDYEWFPAADLPKHVMNRDPNGRGLAYWAFVVVAAPPPAIPRN